MLGCASTKIREPRKTEKTKHNCNGMIKHHASDFRLSVAGSSCQRSAPAPATSPNKNQRIRIWTLLSRSDHEVSTTAGGCVCNQCRTRRRERGVFFFGLGSRALRAGSNPLSWVLCSSATWVQPGSTRRSTTFEWGFSLSGSVRKQLPMLSQGMSKAERPTTRR